MPKDVVMGFDPISVGVSCFQARQVLHLSKLLVWSRGCSTLSCSCVPVLLGSKAPVKRSMQHQITWILLYQWPIPASHQPNYSRCAWGIAMEAGLCAMQGKNLVHKFL